MAFARILFAVLLILVAPLSGAMAGTHADDPHGAMHTATAMDAFDEWADCCADDVERASSCHSEIAPLPPTTICGFGRVSSPIDASGHDLRSGTDPLASLDPPRTA